LTLEEWQRYGPIESLVTYLFAAPKSAKRLYFDVIPRQVDEYLSFLDRYPQQGEIWRQRDNPAWHVHGGQPPTDTCSLNFGLLLNLASVCNTEDPAVLWGFITRYRPDASPEKMPFLDRLVKHAIAYYQDFVKPHKQYRCPTEQEKTALRALKEAFSTVSSPTAEALQTVLYNVGKNSMPTNLRAWFGFLYETLLGQKEGPRLGSFIALYGVPETIALIDTVLVRKEGEQTSPSLSS
jgi:lysyl-tRNA synthetase class 1